MKMLLSLAVTTFLFASNVQASIQKSCFSLTVAGKSDIALMMASLNKKRVLTNYKVEMNDNNKNVVFHLLFLSEVTAKIYYKTIMNNEGFFQRNINIIDSELIEGENSCDRYYLPNNDL